MFRRVVVVVVVTVVVTSVAGTAVARPGRPRPHQPALPTLECGSLPPGDVRLTADLTCTEPFTAVDRNGFALPWDDAAWDQLITIDLGGHTLDISAIQVQCLALYWTPERCGILGPYRIVNGTVVGNLGSVAQVERVTVHGVIYLGSTQGPYGIYEGSHLTNSVVVDGLVRIGTSTTIQRNLLVRSTIDQRWHQTAMTLQILDNIVVAGPDQGIQIEPTEVRNDIGGVVARNLVIGAHGPGILVGGIDGYFSPLGVRDNIVWANEGDGIEVQVWSYGPGSDPTLPPVGGPITIGGNLAIGNGGAGITVTQRDPDRSIVVDAGGNRAFTNAVEPACDVVACG